MTVVNSLEYQIELLGNAFRGLWKSYELTHIDDEKPTEWWCLTFTYKGRIVETPLYELPELCFDFALEKLKIKLMHNG